MQEPIANFSLSSSIHMDLWVQAVPLLEKAVKALHGTHNMVDILEIVASGEGHLWVGTHAAAVTEIAVYPRMRVCNVFLCGADDTKEGLTEFKAWLSKDGPVERFAFNTHDCERLEYVGRPGWVRAMGRIKKLGIHAARDRSDG